MKEKILIAEDQFVVADYLRLMLTRSGYRVTGIARSVTEAQVENGMYVARHRITGIIFSPSKDCQTGNRPVPTFSYCWTNSKDVYSLFPASK